MERWTTHRTNDGPHSWNPHNKAKDMLWIDGDPGKRQLSQPPTTTAVMERWTTHLTNDDPHSLVLGKFGLVQFQAIFARLETGQSGP